MIDIYFFSKSRVSFGNDSKYFYIKNYTTFVNKFKIEGVTVLWKANKAIYKHMKAQYLNMNILYAMADQIAAFYKIT